jgi:HK97 family phage major capsid protein
MPKKTDLNSLLLPPTVSSEILQKMQESSAIMQLSTQITLPGNGITIPIIETDPEPEWVAEGAAKPVKEGTTSAKQMSAYKLAVIEPFSMEFKRDASALYDAMVSRLPGTLATKFDNTVMGGTTKPGDNFDNFSDATKIALTSDDAYKQLVTADADIADQDASMNGIVMSPKMRAILLNAVDGNKRPLFINSVSEGAVPQVLGVPTYQNRGIYVKGSGSGAVDIIGLAGDWTKARYGTVNGIQATISDQATLTTSSGTINLWQQNMFAVRVEIEIGFRADTKCFTAFTKASA